jgi:NADH-ubiquinone oxidoreductase chain 5
MLVTALMLPLLVAIAAGFAGRYLGILGSALLTIGGLGVSLLLTVATFTSTPNAAPAYYAMYTWSHVGTFYLPVEFLFDAVSVTMFVVILTISFIVHIYSTQYLATDPHLPRFLAYLSFFTFFMLFLVASENLVQLFVGWEGVGLCSYLLINFWYTRIQANKAALKAVFVNKIGDIFLLFAISGIYFACGSVSFSTIFATIPYLHTLPFNIFGLTTSLTNWIAICFLVGAIGKSAQIGLHVWLPDAMEGPTPVSALLHAATMVTAGVFLLIRLSFFFEHTPIALLGVLFIGGLTSFFGATTGLLQNDLKRIIAFSTCSQLGYMFVACGLSQYSLGLFHLFNHAFFKALLFLAAGSVIHALGDEQDIRKMGGLFTSLPLTLTFFFIASLSLMGFPFLSGFFSKDIIIEYAAITPIPGHSFAFFCLLSAAFFTAAYSTRLLYFVFLTRPNFLRTSLAIISEPGIITQAPLIFLAIASICSGYLFSDLFVGFGTTFFSSSTATSQQYNVMIDIDFISPLAKQLPLALSILGTVSGYYFLSQTKTLRYLEYTGLYRLFCFFNHKWFFDKVYNRGALGFFRQLYFSFFSYLDKGIIEMSGPFGLFTLLTHASFQLRKLHDGTLTSAGRFLFFGLLFFLLVGSFVF